MTAAELRSILGELADLAGIRGSSGGSGDLRRAAASLGELEPRAFAHLLAQARRHQFDEGTGISPAIRGQLHDIATGGGPSAVHAARAGTPALIRSLLGRSALTSAGVLALVQQVGAVTLHDLGAALDDGRVAAALGHRTEEALRILAVALDVEVERMPLGRACDLLEPLLAAIAAACPAADGLLAAGDVRRFEPMVGDLTLVGRAPDPAEAIAAICRLAGVEDVRHWSPRRAIVVVRRVEVDVRIAAPEEYGTVLFRATGSRRHLAAIHRRRPLPRLARREEDVYAHAGLPHIPPELRQGSDEIDAAASGSLPALVSSDDMRGDLHMHTNYSDGRDTLDAMVAQCRAIGYEYIAITDHSERASASRTITIDQLARQRDQIARLRQRHQGFTILHGIEVEIMPDGRLDFPDAVLETLDIVLASLHDPAGQAGRALTARCIRAMRHPLVNVLTHPANRMVGRDAGHDLDFDAVFAAAAETGTALEVDGGPGHLDLDGDLARRAIAAGATLTIDSDCHRARSLARQMRLGIGTARRGWVEPRHVLNTRPVGEVRAFIRAKRGARC